MKRGIIPLVLLVAIALSMIPSASANSIVKADVGVNSGFFIQAPPLVGQKIQLQVTVGVHDISPVPLNGFFLKVWFKKPDGTTTTPEWFDYSTEYIGKAISKTYTVNTNTIADQAGQWTVYVDLYMTDKTTKINGATATFTVENPVPAGYVTINQVVGYGILSFALVSSLAYAASRGAFR